MNGFQFITNKKMGLIVFSFFSGGLVSAVIVVVVIVVVATHMLRSRTTLYLVLPGTSVVF
ncbi:MAG: hypothetical protein WA323_18790 [Candidatus Nitrosopolaris sp.]